MPQSLELLIANIFLWIYQAIQSALSCKIHYPNLLSLIVLLIQPHPLHC
jgi:hypothetical protein